MKINPSYSFSPHFQGTSTVAFFFGQHKKIVHVLTLLLKEIVNRILQITSYDRGLPSSMYFHRATFRLIIFAILVLRASPHKILCHLKSKTRERRYERWHWHWMQLSVVLIRSKLFTKHTNNIDAKQDAGRRSCETENSKAQQPQC